MTIRRKLLACLSVCFFAFYSMQSMGARNQDGEDTCATSIEGNLANDIVIFPMPDEDKKIIQLTEKGLANAIKSGIIRTGQDLIKLLAEGYRKSNRLQGPAMKLYPPASQANPVVEERDTWKFATPAYQPGGSKYQPGPYTVTPRSRKWREALARILADAKASIANDGSITVN